MLENDNRIVLSVIVPVYNVEEYVEECIESILKQDYQKFELILVDDGSTDSSGAICDKYAAEDERVTVIHQTNAGHTIARQHGVKKSLGKYILLVDSDDWIDEGMLSSMMKEAIAQQTDIVQCSYRSVKNGVPRDEQPIFQEGLYDKGRLEEELYPRMIYAGGFYRFGIAPNMWNKIFKRELVEQFLFEIHPEIRSGEDGLMTFRSFLEAQSVYIMNHCYYNYRSRDNSMCRIMDEKRLDENHLLFSYYQRWLWKDMRIQSQIMHYVVYQTLQAVTELLKAQSLKTIVRKHTYLAQGEQTLEAMSIKQVHLSEIEGKKNKLLLFYLKRLRNIKR